MVGQHSDTATSTAAHVTVWLGEPHQGRGLATGAMQALILHTFRALYRYRLEFRCTTNNVRAAALAERLGFLREGTLRWAANVNGEMVDVALYGLLLDDWIASS